MARWKAHAEFSLSLIELLFLSLAVEALQGKMCQNLLPSAGGRSLGAMISGGRGRPPANILIPLERQLIVADSFYIIKLSSCSVEIVEKTTNLGTLSHFEEVRGGIEPWLMAR